MRYKEYNAEIDDLKKWYLNFLGENFIKENTITCYERMFRRIADFENIIDKKLENFNDKDLVSFLRYLGTSSEYVIESYISLIKNFLAFANDNNKGDLSIDFSRALSTDNLKLYVDLEKNDNKYVTRKELLSKLNKAVDVSDKALVLCVFEGIRGKNNIDLANLKKTDIDFENREITISNEDGQTTYSISEELAYYLTMTCNATEYEYYAGNNPEKKCKELLDSEYVFRPFSNYIDNKNVQNSVERGSVTGLSISTQTITRRLLSTLKEYCGLYYVTVSTLYTSGIYQKIFDILFSDYDKNKTFQGNFVVVAEKMGINKQTAYKLSKNIDELKERYYTDVE